MFLLLSRVSVPEFLVTRPPDFAQTNEFDKLFQRVIATNTAMRDATIWWNRSKKLSREAPFDLFPKDEFDAKRFRIDLIACIEGAKRLDVATAVVFQRLSDPRITEKQMEAVRAFVATSSFKNRCYHAKIAREWARATVPKEYNLVVREIPSRTDDADLRPLLQDYPSSRE